MTSSVSRSILQRSEQRDRYRKRRSGRGMWLSSSEVLQILGALTIRTCLPSCSASYSLVLWSFSSYHLLIHVLFLFPFLSRDILRKLLSRRTFPSCYSRTTSYIQIFPEWRQWSMCTRNMPLHLNMDQIGRISTWSVHLLSLTLYSSHFSYGPSGRTFSRWV